MKIDRNTKREELRDELQPIAKKLMNELRKGILKSDNDNYNNYNMMELELTKEQRESKQPIGTKGLYRMYRWECLECKQVGIKMPYSEMQTNAIKHYEETNHKMVERGGNFPKGDLYS